MNDAPMSGTLFFDGACGMCTRSRDLLLRFNRTGNLQTEPLQAHGVVEDAVYRWVARHRYRFPGTTPYCESHPGAC